MTNNVKAYREKKGLTQEELAGLVNVSRQRYHFYRERPLYLHYHSRIENSSRI